MSTVPLEATHSNNQSRSLSTSSSLTFLFISAIEQEEICLTEAEGSSDKDIDVPDLDNTDMLHNPWAFVIAKEYLDVSGSFLFN